jgi:hypothetical protein
MNRVAAAAPSNAVVTAVETDAAAQRDAATVKDVVDRAAATADTAGRRAPAFRLRRSRGG